MVNCVVQLVSAAFATGYLHWMYTAGRIQSWVAKCLVPSQTIWNTAYHNNQYGDRHHCCITQCVAEWCHTDIRRNGRSVEEAAGMDIVASTSHKQRGPPAQGELLTLYSSFLLPRDDRRQPVIKLSESCHRKLRFFFNAAWLMINALRPATSYSVLSVQYSPLNTLSQQYYSTLYNNTSNNKRVCYCRGTAQRATSVEILWPFFDWAIDKNLC